MNHSKNFNDLVNDAKKRIKEIDVSDLKKLIQTNSDLTLIDVREDDEWHSGHLPDAIHIARGVLERDIESNIPDKTSLIVAYCGGGFRSALACDNLQKMGYKKVFSLAGGFRAWHEANLPIVYSE